MKLVEKGADGAEPVHLSWDAAQAALASGAYDLAAPDGARDVDLPAAQSPAPGTDPKDGEEKAADGQTLTNMTAVSAPKTVSDGLPRAPPPPDPAPAKDAPVLAAPVATQVVADPKPAPAPKPAA